MSPKPRLNYHALASKASKALAQLSYATTIDKRLKELINLRISQINGCAFCIDMHWADLVKQGMDPRHLNAIAGWREAHRFFSEKERAALNWAETVNALPHRTAADADFEEMQKHYSDAEIAEITFVVGAIRAWNMLNASFHMPVPEVPYSAG